jgi:hypothetical protein
MDHGFTLLLDYLLIIGKFGIIGGLIIAAIGFFIVISGQAISCMVSIARHTATTNTLLTRQTELLEASSIKE